MERGCSGYDAAWPDGAASSVAHERVRAARTDTVEPLRRHLRGEPPVFAVRPVDAPGLLAALQADGAHEHHHRHGAGAFLVRGLVGVVVCGVLVHAGQSSTTANGPTPVRTSKPLDAGVATA